MCICIFYIYNIYTFCILAILKNAAVNIYIQVSDFLLSVILVIYVGTELLDHMGILYLTFRETAKRLFTLAVSFYIPTSNV